MKHLWNRITLDCYRAPGDKPAPWYAYPLTVVFVVCVYAFMQVGQAAGF